MTYTEGLKQGSATMSRIAEKNPQHLIIEVMEDDPQAGPEKLFKKWYALIKDDEDYLVPALRHAFTNMLNNIDRGRPKRTRKKPNQKAREQEVALLKERIEKVLFLNLMLPTGKLLRESTFAECANVGGWFGKIAKKGKPHEIVGDVLSEEQIRKIR